MTEQSNGASLRDRAVVNGAGQAVSAMRASVPSADDLDHCYAVVGELLEYFDSYRLATWAPLASIIEREIAKERAACANLARQWSDENKGSSREARRRGKTELADMIEGAAIECNALAQAIEARRAETGTGSVHESAVPAGDAS